MPVYRPTELIEFLKGLGVSAKKGLSQNFLIDGNICRKMIKEAEIQPGDAVLEIGPGPGVMTELMLEAGAHVIAVEKDAVLAKALERFQNQNLSIYCDDILKFPFHERLPGKVKVVSNLPYHITTPILTRLVAKHDQFTKIVVMVQDEVARRFVAKPGTPDYGSLSVFLQFHADVRYAFQVSHNCFFPKPKVESAVTVLDVRTPPDVSNEEKFFEMTRRGFQTRRKMLRKAISDLYPSKEVEKTLSDMDLNPKARAEELSLEQFLELYERLSSKSSENF